MEKCAKANAFNMPVSRKVSYEICNAIRGKSVQKALAFLNRVSLKQEAVPYKRYNRDTPHRPGKIAAGRYPVKGVQYFIAAIENAVTNARDIGLNDENLQLVHVCSNFGSSQWSGGRQGRKKMKTTHLEIVVMETSQKRDTSKKAVKSEKVADEKKTVKTEVKSEKVADEKKVEGKQ